MDLLQTEFILKYLNKTKLCTKIIHNISKKKSLWHKMHTWITSSARSLHLCALGCLVSPSGSPHGLSLLGTGLVLIFLSTSTKRTYGIHKNQVKVTLKFIHNTNNTHPLNSKLYKYTNKNKRIIRTCCHSQVQKLIHSEAKQEKSQVIRLITSG